MWLLLLVLSVVGLARGGETTSAVPDVGWETVPRFAFLALRRDERLSDAQAAHLARHYPLVVLSQHRPTGAEERSEDGIFRAAEQVKAVNPNVKVLFYWNATLAIPGFRARETFARRPDWALRDDSRQLLRIRGLETFDVTRPDVRDWWSDVCRAAVREPAIDGVFADAIAKYGMAAGPVRRAVSPARRQALADGLDEMLRESREKMGPEKLLIFNGLRGDFDAWQDGGFRYLDHTSGAIVEHFCGFSSRDPASGRLDKQHAANDIELIRNAALAGKIVLVKGWPGNWNWTTDGFAELTAKRRREILLENVTFPLAAFLVAAEGGCYFSYTFGYLADHGLFEPLPEWQHPLGEPKSPAKRDGWEYSRQFERASVRVNLETEEATIDWK